MTLHPIIFMKTMGPRAATVAQPVKRSLRQKRSGQRQLLVGGGQPVTPEADKAFKLESVTLAAIDKRFALIDHQMESKPA